MQNQIKPLVTPVKIEIEELKNLFFVLCQKSCNLKCKHCYIDNVGENKNSKDGNDFLDIEKIKTSLATIKKESLNSIYLTGGEPLMHPEFNKILRMCLKVTNVTVMSNGVMINDKKARFLRKIDDESEFETIYRISLDSTDEIQNDFLRGRGSFRKALCAVFALLKYEFNPIISVVNYWNKPNEQIKDEFKKFFSKNGFDLEDINLKIIPYFKKENNEDFEIKENFNKKLLDCATSRVLSQTGVYCCLMLCGDYRAKLGTSLEDYSNTTYLDCSQCAICTSSEQKAMVNDWM